MASLVESFVLAGLPKAKAEQTAKNDKLAPVLAKIINDADITGSDKNPKQGNLLLHLATNGQKLSDEDRLALSSRIADGRYTSLDQLSAGMKYLEDGADRADATALDKASGVGVVVSVEEIGSTIEKYMGENAAKLAESTWASLPNTIAALKLDDTLRWANPLELKNNLEKAFTDKYGTKEEYNKANKSTPKGGKAAKKPAAGAEAGKKAQDEVPAASTSSTSMFEEGFLAKLHPVGGNPQIHPHLKDAHLKAVQGLVHTRFPPEPNGFLHIGHSKAIAVNFGFAQFHGGRCYLRYDDTNPEAEEQVYIDSILEIVRWLGFEPFKITYSSDHFQELYELAVELIKRDKAYMCYCTPEEVKAGRGGPEHGPRKACEHRSRPVQESLEGFEKMKQGGFEAGKATLRMKMDLEDPNPMMWDTVAYRTLKKPHHRTGTEWCIYPTYDFTHCLCDSFENITHSLCTTEFVLSRQSYEWLCDAVEVYKPRQSEYGRLNLQGTVMSKRKIMKLVKEGHVKDWDDPRLYTLIALRRRGVPPGAILSFVNGLGVTTGETLITTHRFEQSVRSYLEVSTPRLMLVLRPLKVTLENVPEDYVEWAEKPLHSKDASMGTNKLPLTRTVYIDASDFRTQDSKEFFRLAPGKTVGLLYASYPITCTSYKTDEKTGEVTEVLARYEGFDVDPSKRVAPGKVKTYIHWVSEHAESASPVKVKETRIFKQLFKSDDPSATEDFLADLAPDSLETVTGAFLEVGFYDIVNRVRDEASKTKKEQEAATHDPSKALSGGATGGNERVRFQGLRTAYFALDREAKVAALESGGKGDISDEIILNWTVSLKEDKTK